MCESTCIATKSKSVLIVFAHQDEKSFNGALKRVAVETLESKGFAVEVSDLYSQNFEPRSTKNDVLGSLLNEEVFNYAEEGRNAFRNDSLSNDIAQEIARLKKADLVIFQFPLYWSSVPAILKGWFDRIFCDSFAFDYETQNILDQGFMKGKRAVLSLTTGCTKEMVSPQGLGGDMNVLLWHIQYGTLRMCGFDVLQPQISYGTKLVDADTRELYMKNWESRLQNIFTEEPLPFPKLSDFNPETMILNKKNGVQEVFSIGHHTANND